MIYRTSSLILALAVLAAIAGATYGAIAPAYSSGATAVEQNGTWVLGLLAAFLGLALAPLASPRRWRGTIAIWAGSGLLAAMLLTVAAMLFAPAALLLIIAGALNRRKAPSAT